jgi:hypothetical protein
LNLEFERVTQNKDESSRHLLKSYLFIINDCSYDLQVKFKKHLQTFIEQTDDKDNIFKQQYVADIIKWIIESNIWKDKNKQFSKELYEYVFSFLYHQSYYPVQKAILNSLYLVFRDTRLDKEHVLLTNKTIHYLETIIYSYSKYSDDVLAICLLIYGIYLHNLQKFDITYLVPNEIEQTLTTLLTSSSSTKIISTRAGLCLVIAELSPGESIEIPQQFKKKWQLKDENEYDMLLQETLFESYGYGSEIVRYISSHFTICLDKFVRELNDYLRNKCYSSDLSPNYVRIAYKFSGENFQKFQRALQTNSIDEVTLKRNVYDYANYAKTTTDYTVAVELYGKFGILTEELSQMFEWAEVRYVSSIPISLHEIKDVSDRETIQMLFEKLKLFVDKGNFEFGSFILRLLIKLADVGVVSSFEVHQHVSDIINTPGM